jgi:hypothetical protein
LKGRTDANEFNPNYLELLQGIFELNFASALVDKMLTQLNHKTIITATQIARNGMLKCRRLAEECQKIDTPLCKTWSVWFKIALSHFDLLTCLCIYQTNGLIKTKVLDSKGKSIAQVYFDDKMVGERILQLREDLKNLANGFTQFDKFSFHDSCLYSSMMVNDGLVEVIKE